MTENPRLEALRLATAVPEDPHFTVQRAEAYLAFLTDRTITVSVNVDAAAAAKEIAGAAEEAEKAAATKAPKEPKPKPAPKAEPEPEPEAPKAEPEPEYTIDQVRAALKEYRSIEGAPAMLEVLKTHGGSDQLTSVDPSKYGAIMEAVNAA